MAERRLFRLPYEQSLTARAREFRKTMTPAERKLWREVLSGRKLENSRWLRQRPIDHFIVDFYCPELKLVVEIDGGIHRARIGSDAERSSILKGYGLTLIRFTNEEVLADLPSIRRKLVEYIHSHRGFH